MLLNKRIFLIISILNLLYTPRSILQIFRNFCERSKYISSYIDLHKFSISIIAHFDCNLSKHLIRVIARDEELIVLLSQCWRYNNNNIQSFY